MQIKHGKSIEITEQLKPHAAEAIAQWIGSYTVIANQKTIHSKQDYLDWINSGKPEDNQPSQNTKVAHLNSYLPFLKGVPSQIRRNAGAKWLESLNAAKVGLRKHPRIKKKHQKRNCYVTSELFDIQALDANRCLIQLKRDDTKKTKGSYLAGFVMPFPKEDAGKSLFLSRKGRRFWLSMTYSLEVDCLPESNVKSLITDLSDAELGLNVVGYDLGVVRQATGSDRSIYHLDETAQRQLDKLEARKVRYQRRYARIARANDRQQGSVKRKRTQTEKKLTVKLAKYAEKKAGIQRNNSHHISKAIAENTPLVAVFENMKISNMVRRAKAKQDPVTGKWLRNGQTTKSGLNKAILNANMGQIRSFTKYKLAEKSKLLITVKTAHSSQECSNCGYTDKGNRPSQAIFKCLNCQHEMNADDNAALVIKGRGIKHIRSEAFSKEKTVRKISARRKVVQAHELASSGGGEHVSLVFEQAKLVEALNSHSDCQLS